MQLTILERLNFNKLKFSFVEDSNLREF